MIVRQAHDAWLLISQVDHARVAAQIAAVWRLPASLAGEIRAFEYAVAHHDDGWREWERRPTIDADGRPRDFMDMPMPVATRLWSSSIDVAARESAWCALWVSRHFCHLAERSIEHRDDPRDQTAASRFVVDQARQRRDWRHSAGSDAVADGSSALEIAGLRGLQFFDRLSLWLCCAERTKPLEVDDSAGCATRWEPAGTGQVGVYADAFVRPELTLSVPTIAVPQRVYARDADLQSAIAVGDRGLLSWTLVGRRTSG